MNLCPVVPSGETHLVVTPHVAVSFLKLEETRVLGIPWVIVHIEIMARDSRISLP